MTISRLGALGLLTKCRGDEIWSVEHCRQAGVPDEWIEELCDIFESGLRTDSQTIYVENEVTNQYRGVRDLDLAIHIARSIGLDVDRIITASPDRRRIVRAIKEAVMDGE